MKLDKFLFHVEILGHFNFCDNPVIYFTQHHSTPPPLHSPTTTLLVRVPTVMENPGKSWGKKLSWKLKKINKVMETEENK